MADYPVWVLKYKEKGTYINCVKGKYYLYAAHSERVPGTKKVKRVCDGYLGRITEEDGLIPPKDKVDGTISVLEYGLSCTILSVCSNIHSSFRKSFVKNGDFVMAASILHFLYGRFNSFLYHQSYLSVRFAMLDMDTEPTPLQKTGIERGQKMIADTMQRHFKADYEKALFLLGRVYKVKVNGKIYRSDESECIIEFRLKHHVEWED